MARRAEKKQATRERIIAAATDLFCRQGYDATTVDQIVAVAGISQRSFFRYFPTKLHVAFPYNEETTRHLEDLLERHRDPRAPLLGVRDALTAYGRWFGDRRGEVLREWRYVRESPSLVARDAESDRTNAALIARTLETCGYSGRRARILAGILYGGVNAILAEWMDDGCREDLLAVGSDLATLLEHLDAIVAAPDDGEAAAPPRPPRARRA